MGFILPESNSQNRDRVDIGKDISGRDPQKDIGPTSAKRDRADQISADIRLPMLPGYPSVDLGRYRPTSGRRREATRVMVYTNVFGWKPGQYDSPTPASTN